MEHRKKTTDKNHSRIIKAESLVHAWHLSTDDDERKVLAREIIVQLLPLVEQDDPQAVILFRTVLRSWDPLPVQDGIESGA